MKAASVYGRIGWAVHPLHSVVGDVCSCSRGSACPSPGKHPRLRDWTSAATNDLEQIAEWAAQWPTANVGIATGAASGFWVLDVDPGNGGPEALADLVNEHGDLPETVTAQTGSGGTHYLFALPEGFTVTNTASKIGRGLDTRGDGGQIVVAPSVSAKGPYRWVVPPWSHPIADAPEWLLDLLRTTAPQRGAPASSGERLKFPPASPEVLEAACVALEEEHGPAVEGNGGDQHTWLAAAILRNDFALTEDEAWPLLVEWNETCSPAWDEEDLRAKLRGGAKYASKPYGCARPADLVEVARSILNEWRDVGQTADPYGLATGQRLRDLIHVYNPDPLIREEIENEGLSTLRKSKTALAIPKTKVRAARRLATVMTTPTEDGVATLVEKEFGDQLRYCKAWGTWLRWAETNWEREQTDLVFDFCRDFARTANPEKKAAIGKASFARGVEAFARASRVFATTPDQWDSSEWDLNTPNGVVDLRTGQIRPHEPTDYITRCTQIAPEPGPMPAFKKFMREISCGDDELVQYHQTSLGASLSGARMDHFFLFWNGGGSNGKNTLGDLVAWLLGSYAKTIPSETLMSAKNERPGQPARRTARDLE